MSDPVDASLEELHALVNLIKTSVDQIEKTYKSNKQPYPSLNGPFNPPSEGLRMSPEVQQAGDILVAAASQLIATVRPPFTTTIVYGLSFHIEASMRVAVENHVVEILREAGPQGLHVRDIAAHTKVNPEKLARILRLLATHHMFREVAPDVFANNAISMTLDTGKPVEAILADPEAKYDNTSGVAALVAHSGDEVLKATGYLQEVLADPSWTASGDPAKTSLQKAFNMNVPYWEWLEAPGNSSRRRRFAAGMTGLSNATYSSAILEGFEWKELPKDSVVVDVGGGVGSQSLLLAKAFDHLKLIVQDRPAVVTENAPGYWKENLPEALSSGQVVLQAHDFFAPQPVKSPAIFLLRCILHDWSDEYAIKILRQLRDAAGPKTQLLVIESLMSYACPTPENTKKVPGQVENTFPEPLLPNRGAASSMAALSDLLMLNLINATERTLEQYDQLFEQGGWKLTRVHLAGGPQGAKLVAVPA